MRFDRVVWCLAVVLTFLPAFSWAQSWSAPVNISNSPGYWSVGACMDFDSAGKVYVAYEDWWDAAHSVYLASNQTGEWRTQLVASDARIPVMRITPDGTIHFFYKKNSRVWETTRALAGSTWTSPEAIDPGYSSGDLWPSWAAVDSTGGLYVIWLHLFDDTLSPRNAIWGRYKPLAGSWGNAEQIATGKSDDSRFPQNTVVIANGTSFYASYDYYGAKYRVRINGVWSGEKSLSSSGGASRIAFSPTGEMAGAWAEDIGGNSWFEVLVKFSYDGGNTWTSPLNVSNYYYLDRIPEITYDASGNFHLIYQRFDYDGAQPDIWYVSRLSGVWQPIRNLTSTPGRTGCGFQAIRAFGNDLHFVYADNTANGVEELYYKSTHLSAPPNTGTISGTVKDTTGVIVGGAVVVASPGDYTAAADLSGKYVVLGVPVGTYALTASKDWYTPQTKAGIVVSANQTTTVDFNIAPDSVAPGPPVAFSATAGNGKVTLRWLTPADADFRGTVIRCSTDGYPATPTDGLLAFNTTGSPNGWGWQEHTGLVNGVTYYYSAFSYDQLNNYSAAKHGAAVPEAAPKPNLLSDGGLDSFAGGVATGWNAYRANDPSSVLVFQSDGTNYFTSPSQAVANLGSTSLPTSGYTAAGIMQSVSAVPGRVYMLTGYQDIYTSDYGADGQRYVHNFGIDPSGGTDPGVPNGNGTIAGAKWLPSDIVFWNNSKGSSCYYGGFHRLHAAWTAASASVSVWSGVTINNAGVRDNVPAIFNADQMYLFEFDNPPNSSGVIRNGGFEDASDLQNNGDCIPAGWAPVGGAIGQTQTSECDALGARTGDRGVRVFNRRGAICYGLMQRLSTAPGTSVIFGAWAKSGSSDTEVAVGIDASGGTDINASGVQWSGSTSADWAYVSQSVAAADSSVTVFIRVKSMAAATYDGYHVGCFDDAVATWTPGVGSVSGIVKDSGGNLMAGAVVATGTGGYTATSGEDGGYVLPGVTPGSYSVTASKSGYTPQTVANVSVTAGQTTALDITLAVPERSMAESKSLADGTPVTITGCVVTAVFDGFFYIGRPDRSGGLRVESPAVVSLGADVQVTGRMSTVCGERYIICLVPKVL